MSSRPPSRSLAPIGPAILPGLCSRSTADSRGPSSDPSSVPHPASRFVMQAIVKEKPAAGLTVKSVPKPTAGPGDALIAVRNAGVCGTDLHIADWDAWAQGRLTPPRGVRPALGGDKEMGGDGDDAIKPG